MIRNNIFGFYPRHGASFWQETDNPRLGASENRIVHNLFITADARPAVQFINHSNRNEFANNVILAVRGERQPGDGEPGRDPDGGRQYGRRATSIAAISTSRARSRAAARMRRRRCGRSSRRVGLRISLPL